MDWYILVMRCQDLKFGCWYDKGNPSFIHCTCLFGSKPCVNRVNRGGSVGPSGRAASDLSPVLFLPHLPRASQWDAFSIPELQNFLTILEKEEQDKIQQVQKKYDKFRQKLEEALRESQGKPG